MPIRAIYLIGNAKPFVEVGSNFYGSIITQIRELEEHKFNVYGKNFAKLDEPHGKEAEEKIIAEIRSNNVVIIYE